MKEAGFVISFASFAAVEANFLGKKIIQVGQSRYREFKISNQFKNGVEAAEALVAGNLKEMSSKGSYIYAAGYMHTKNEHINLEKEMEKFSIGRVEYLLSNVIRYISKYRVS